MISLDLASAIARNAAQALALLALAGVLVGLFRWRHARRRDFLLSFIVFLAGTTIVQVPVFIGGMVGWGADLVLLSGVARLIQDLGAVLFIRASLIDQCPPWGWKSIVFLVLAITVLL